FNTLVTYLQGKKTYLVCLIAILAAILAYLNHQIDLIQLGEAILAALGGASLRSAQNTTAQKVLDAQQAAINVVAQLPAKQLPVPGPASPGPVGRDPNDLG
ncbi:MAG: hypothetical protein ACRETL_03945, partial [Gammaproteobacteria bacterium]